MTRKTISPVGTAFLVATLLLTLNAGVAFAQSSATTPYIPGVTYQTTNPNYPLPNPFYFEGRIEWNLLKITTPSTAWDYEQRGIYEQDDLQDPADAIKDYQQAISMNSLDNATCQIVTGPIPTSGNLNPPPCMFTVRLRLAGLLQQSNPQQAIALYQEVVKIDPLKLGVHEALAKTYVGMAQAETVAANAAADYTNAITEYQAELALSPVTPFTTSLTADQANNAHVHWGLASIYQIQGDTTDEASELNLYLLATQWHSDTYPWRINLAKARLAALGNSPAARPRAPARPRAEAPKN